MVRLITFSCLLAVALATPYTTELDSEWTAFMLTHGKKYHDKVEPLRRLIWERNVRYIQKHNLEADRGLHTYTLGMNEYGDMTPREFVSAMNGYKVNSTLSVCTNYQPPLNIELSDLPQTVDWKKKGYVTEVKNQGQCGSCYAFSAIGSLEGQHFRATGKLVSLSEKNIMDCSQAEGNLGCVGGLTSQAFTYVIKNKGVDTEESYPYKPVESTCAFKPANVGATEQGCKAIQKGSECDLQKAVATVGPISVAIDAGHVSFQFYKSGVYTESQCSQTVLDHGGLVVGYGKQDAKDYWMLKNSWGKTWGMDGYIMMARNHNNMCGIATMATFPTGVN